MNVMEGYRFWEWFCNNHTRYLRLHQLDEEERDALFDELNGRLNKYCIGLYAEFRRMNAHSRDLIITAEGDEQYFMQAEDLVLMAPKVQGWNIVALRPAEWDYPLCITCEEIEIRSDELWFSVFDEKGEPHKLSLLVYFKTFDSEKEDIYFRAAGEMLDIILGEKSSALEVPYLCVKALPEQVDMATTMSLEDLPAYMEFWREQVLMN